MYCDLLEVRGIKSSIMGMRNPMKSRALSDSYVEGSQEVIGSKDLKLAKSLAHASPEHGKFLRQIQVWVDIYAPRYFWSEFDTYGFHTSNSESTMHTLCKRDLVLDDFEIDIDGIEYELTYQLERAILVLNAISKEYRETRDNNLLLLIKSLLPESYIQMRTVNVNYQQLKNMYHQRKNHRLPQWREFCEWCESLPYFKELCIEGKM